MKAIIYARVSTQEQADGKFSIETQLQDCQQHCERQGDEVIQTYVEVQSGRDAIKDREQFEQMLNDARTRLFEKIVVWRPDRLFRGLSPAAKLAKVLDETGIVIEGVLQPLDRRMIGLWAWVAEQEIEGMKERFDAGKRASVKELGKWCGGGFIPYGYTYNPDQKSDSYTGKLEINEDEAKVIQDMFQKIADGWTISQWVNWANKEGIPTKHRSKGWNRSNVSMMLRNTAYIGQGYYGKQKWRGKKLVKGDKLTPWQYPAIITQDLFYKVRLRLVENKCKNRGSAKKIYLLMHLGRCGECGGRLGCRSVHDYQGAKERSYLYCGRQRAYPQIHECYQPRMWRMEPIEEYIWAEVIDVLRNYRNDTINVLLERLENSKGKREKQVIAAQDKLEQLTWEKQRVLTAIRKGYATEDEAETQFAAIKSEREYWEQELANLNSIQNDENSAVDAFLAQLRKLEGWFDFGLYPTPTPEQKKEILNSLLKEFIIYKDGTIELRFKVPTDDKKVVDTITTLFDYNVA